MVRLKHSVTLTLNQKNWQNKLHTCFFFPFNFCRSRVLHHVHSFVPEHPINYIPSFGNSNKVVFLKAAKPQMFNKSKHLNLARHTKGFRTKALYGLIMHWQSYSPGWPPNRSFRFGLFLFGEMPRLQLGVFRHFRRPRDSTWPRYVCHFWNFVWPWLIYQ